MHDLDLRHGSLPAQPSLGVFWNLERDAFTFKASLPEKSFTRRGVMSIVNSVNDTLGFAVPVIAQREKDTVAACTYGRMDKGEQYPPIA